MDAEPRDIARSAGLRYVSDVLPGIERRRDRGTFTYWDARGKIINDERELARIRSIAVPPAYDEVWISPFANGHIQATARDARGRKQYRYHAKWREACDSTKYDRMLDFAEALPKIRRCVAHDLGLVGMPRERVLAAVVRLLESSSIRIGNEEYARTNDSFGLTTFQNRHAKVSGSVVRFSFHGKSGVRHAVSISDRSLARVVRRCQEIPGQELFEYIVDGEPHGIGSADVNDYIRDCAGEQFTAKDFRTWVGTLTFVTALLGANECESESDRKARVAEALAAAARQLGNTATVCRKSYVHPELVNRFLAKGTLGKMTQRNAKGGLAPEERFVIRLLKSA